jgi:aminopeptidase YwaD
MKPVCAIAPLLLCASELAAPRSAIPSSQRFFELVRPRYSGDSALAIVAFMDDYWRLPGNTGFTKSIERVTETLRAAGYEDERTASLGTRLIYRIETRPVPRAWEPESASVSLVSAGGAERPLLRTATNRNMLAINSHSTPPSGIVREVVAVSELTDDALDRIDIAGKIVYADAPVGRLFAQAVQKRGAAGVLAYNMPKYTKPEVHRRSILCSRSRHASRFARRSPPAPCGCASTSRRECVRPRSRR